MNQPDQNMFPSPNPTIVPTPTIAMIGLEGSGKTILATTLAKRLSRIDGRGVFLNPQGVKTLRYVEHVWNILQSGDWPPSTPPGEKFELAWKLNIVGEPESDLRLVDVAGQDLRLLFGDEQIYTGDSLPAHLQSLGEYCYSADIVLFLVNLKDFTGQGDSERRAANEAAIKSAMDYLSSDGRGRRVCLVLTQADLYREIAHEHGGWQEIVSDTIPYIFGAHIMVRSMKVLPVAAVDDTNVTVDRDGTARRVPVAGFQSDGFDELVDWLTIQVREVKQELEQAHSAAQTTSVPHAIDPPLGGPKKQLGWTRAKKCAWIVVFILGVLFARSRSYSTPTPDSLTRPKPVLVNPRYRDNPGIVWDSVTALGIVKNEGAAGNVVVTSNVMENCVEVDRKSQSFFLNAGESREYTMEMSGIKDCKNPHDVGTTVKVP